MRVNVYGEEITDRIELVEKRVDEGGEIYTFYGIRFWLKFPTQEWWIHRKIDGHMDDDSTAITIWHRDKDKLELMFRRALGVLDGRYSEYGINKIDGDTDRPSTLGKEASGPYENPDLDAPRRRPEVHIQPRPVIDSPQA